MTISELAKLNKANGGHFFDRATLKGNRETLASFRIAPHNKADATVVVVRKGDGYTWTFDKKTGRLAHSVKFQEKLDGARVNVTA
jgi:hypothetical protein